MRVLLQFYYAHSSDIYYENMNQRSMEKAEWIFRYSEGTSVTGVEAAVRGFTEYTDVPECLGSILFANRDGLLTCYVIEMEGERVREEGRLFFDARYRRSFEDNIKARAEEFQSFWEQFRKVGVSGSLNEELLGFAESYINHLANLFTYYKVVGGRVFPLIEEEVKHALAKHYAGADLEDSYSVLLTATGMDILEREEIELRKMAEHGSEISDEDLRRHAKLYSAKYLLVYDEQKIFAALRERLKSLKRDGKSAEEALREIREQKRITKGRQEMIEATLNDPNIIDIARFLREQGQLRFDYKEWFMAEYKFFDLFQEIAARIGIPLEEFMLTYRMEDIRAFITSGATLEEDEKKARRQLYIIRKLNGGEPEFMSGEPAEKAVFELLGTPSSDTQLRGVIASRGKVEGRVRILLPRDFIQIEEDLKRFKKGEILVTTMTQPSIVSAMKKAAAIVTDQGGMTSHAAVLAREFGIPCIVGTVTATQIFKDGDLVEVDANQGFVRIIEV